MKEIDENAMEKILASQIKDSESEEKVTEEVKEEKPKNEASQYLGTHLTHKVGGYGEVDKEETQELVKEKKLSRIGENIAQNANIRDGWMEVDKRLLGDRAVFYPEDWQFRIRPATVEAIRNWSTIDDENPSSVDEVFNEILKSCLSIVTSTGVIPCMNIRSWDRFFFILLIREYTFINGEKKIEFSEDCPTCDNSVIFNLTSQSLMYEMPDPSVMKYFSTEEQTWMINPTEYEVEWPEPVILYLPTLEKDAAIKSWLIDRLQRDKKVDQVFVKFLPWLAPKISKDLTIATRQIREYEAKFNEWDTDMFDFMDEVINNITVIPNTKLITTCPICGEEVTADINFQDGIRSLFSVSSGRKKFGKK